MTSFFTCMAKFMDVEDKCAAERRALTNCTTAAVSHGSGCWGLGWADFRGGGCIPLCRPAQNAAGRAHSPSIAAPTGPLVHHVCPQMRKGKQTNTINYHLQRLGRMIRR